MIEETVDIRRFSQETGIPVPALGSMCKDGTLHCQGMISKRMHRRFLMSQKEQALKGYEVRNKQWKMQMSTDKRQYSVNESFFDQLNADSAYVLGYIWTDGCIKRFGKGSWGILLECSSKDKEMLENIKRVMKAENPIRIRNRILPSGKKIEVAKLCIYSRKLVDALKRYGIIERKSKADPVPVGIPDEFVFDFIRGILDGDGSVGTASKNPQLFRITFTGKANLLKWVDKVFVDKLGTKPRVLYRSCPTFLTRSECWVMVYSRQGDIHKIMSALHDKCHLFLTRKRIENCVISNAA